MPSLKIVLTLLLLNLADAAQAIVMRHDVPESKYLTAAKRFPQAVDVGNVGVGTLVGPRWVLTAAHVVEGMQTNGIEPFVMIGDRRIAVQESIIHPDWQGFDAELSSDIALLFLVEPVREVRPAKLYKEYDEVDKQIWFVGNGRPGTGKTGPKKGDTKLFRAATNTVAQAPRAQLIFYFDAPGMGATALEGVSGPGDSGGPALLESGGRLYVVGVSTAGDDTNEDGITSGYGDLEIYARVAHYREWLVSIMSSR